MAKKSTAEISIKADEEWRVESDLRTMIEAEAIKTDPKRYAKVQAMAKKRMMETAKVAGGDGIEDANGCPGSGGAGVRQGKGCRRGGLLVGGCWPLGCSCCVASAHGACLLYVHSCCPRYPPSVGPRPAGRPVCAAAAQRLSVHAGRRRLHGRRGPGAAPAAGRAGPARRWR